MTVTVWHANPREYYRTYEGVEHVERGAYGDISLYTRALSETDNGQLIASFGPGDCWAIETDEAAT